MPVYEYRCKDCGKEFEYQQRMSDDPKTVCESCEGQLERLISRTSFHLKGGGWYKDLYSSAKKDGAAKDSDSSAKGDGKSDSSSPSSSSSSSGSTSSSTSSEASGATDSD